MVEHEEEIARLSIRVEALEKEVKRLDERSERVPDESSSEFPVVGIVVISSIFLLGLGTLTLSIEYVRTVVTAPWLSLELKYSIAILAVLMASFIMQLIFFAYSLRFLMRIALLPLTFLFAYAVAFALGYEIRPVTFGSFMGDAMGIAYFPTIFGLGIAKGIIAIGGEGARNACLASYQLGEILGQDQTLNISWLAIKNLLGYTFLPWQYDGLRSHIWSLSSATQSSMHWRGSLNVTSYSVDLGYIWTCAFQGAFHDWHGLWLKFYDESYGLFLLFYGWLESWIQWGWSTLKDLAGFQGK